MANVGPQSSHSSPDPFVSLGPGQDGLFVLRGAGPPRAAPPHRGTLIWPPASTQNQVREPTLYTSTAHVCQVKGRVLIAGVRRWRVGVSPRKHKVQVGGNAEKVGKHMVELHESSA